MQASQQTYEDTQVQSPQPIWPQEQLPIGVHNIEFSWDRFCRHDGGYMRVIFRDLTDDPNTKVKHPHHGFIEHKGRLLPLWRGFPNAEGEHESIRSTQIPEGEYKIIGGWTHPYTFWFKEYLGKAEILGTNNEEGRLYLRAMARIDNETLTMYRDPAAPPHKIVEGVVREKTHNRLCYRRATEEWRLRDERLEWNHPDALVFTKSYKGDLNAEWHANDSVAHIYHNGYAIIDKDDVAHLYDTEL